MIVSFASKMVADIFNGVNSRHARKLPVSLHSKAHRLLDQINATTRIDTLRVPPSNKLSKLTGNYKGFWRLKIDKQWAIIFIWNNGNAENVDIVDYH